MGLVMSELMSGLMSGPHLQSQMSVLWLGTMETCLGGSNGESKLNTISKPTLTLSKWETPSSSFDQSHTQTEFICLYFYHRAAHLKIFDISLTSDFTGNGISVLSLL